MRTKKEIDFKCKKLKIHENQLYELITNLLFEKGTNKISIE